MRKLLLATTYIGLLGLVGAGAQVLNAPPTFIPATFSGSSGTIWSTTATPSTASITAQQTIVLKILCPGTSGSACAINSAPGLATKTLIKYFGAVSGSYTIANACIGSGGGTKAWDFGSATTVTRIKCSGSVACSSSSTADVTADLATYVPSNSVPLMLSVDLSASVTNAKPNYVVKISPNNVNPIGTNLGNYLAYSKNGVQEACTSTKQTSYASPYGGVADTFAFLKSIGVQ